MATRHQGVNTTVIVVACLGSLAGIAGAAVQYTITDLGRNGGQLVAINDAGQVAGSMKMPDGSYQAFTWSAGQLAMLPKLVGNSYVAALNDKGQIVGQAAAGTGETNQRAVLWQNGTIQDLNTGSGPTLFIARGVNNSGQIVVRSSTSTYLIDGGALQDLGFEQGSALDEAGQVVGARNTGQSDVNGPIAHAVLWNSGGIHDLGTLGDKRSEAWSINNSGLVVGAAGSWSPDIACYWDAAGIHQLPLTSTTSQAYGVNDVGQIVGMYSPATDPVYGHAFIYANGIAQDLNDLVDPASGWLLDVAWDINNSGDIVGLGLLQGQTRSFLLTPVPLPATLVLSLPGLLWVRRRIRS